MGTILSNTSSTNIYNIDVHKSPSGKTQTVVYSTTEGRTLTFRGVVGVKNAYYSLRDNTCTRSGTSIDMKVQLRPRKSGGMVIKNLTHEGDILDVKLNEDEGSVTVEYGGTLKKGAFHVTSFSPGNGDSGLVVIHFLGSGSDSCLVIYRVWYDVEKGNFACDRIGPFRRPTAAELRIDWDYALRHSSYPASSTAVNQTAITGRISNDGRVRGNFNGAINNFFNNFYANR